MSANQLCGVCWKTGEPGHECPSCDRPDCPFAGRDRRRREFFDQIAVKPEPGTEPWLNDDSGVIGKGGSDAR